MAATRESRFGLHRSVALDVMLWLSVEFRGNQVRVSSLNSFDMKLTVQRLRVH